MGPAETQTRLRDRPGPRLPTYPGETPRRRDHRTRTPARRGRGPRVRHAELADHVAGPLHPVRRQLRPVFGAVPRRTSRRGSTYPRALPQSREQMVPVPGGLHGLGPRGVVERHGEDPTDGPERGPDLFNGRDGRSPAERPGPEREEEPGQADQWKESSAIMQPLDSYWLQAVGTACVCFRTVSRAWDLFMPALW